LRLGEIMHFCNGKKRPMGYGSIPVYGSNGVLDYTNSANRENGIIIGRVGAYCGSVFYEPNRHWVSDENLSIIECMASGSTFKEVSGSIMKGIPAIIPDEEMRYVEI